MQIIYLVVLFIVSLIDMRIMTNEDYCDIKQTNAVKGFWIGLVFLSHCNGYLHYNNSLLNRIYNIPFAIIGQLMVVMFLFYSGYGIATQYEKKQMYM